MKIGERGLDRGIRFTPTYYLNLYKASTRPRPCCRCRANAYYQHPELGRVCAACLLDLINIGEVLWKWKDYPEIWARMDYLISKNSGTVKNTTQSETNVREG